MHESGGDEGTGEGGVGPVGLEPRDGGVEQQIRRRQRREDGTPALASVRPRHLQETTHGSDFDNRLQRLERGRFRRFQKVGKRKITVFQRL